MKFINNKQKGSQDSDLALLQQYQRTGKLEPLAQLYERYMHLVFGICLSFYKDEDKSKDAVMDIFEELIPKLKIHQVLNFKSWLHVLTRNHCLMELRKTAKYTNENIDDHLMDLEDFVHLDVEDVKETQLTQLEKCLNTLSDEQKICVDLFYLQEKCYKDIAEITGYDLNQVKSYIQNGKRNLKNCIDKNSGN
ncbi:MAG: sigma-70 family RNA polymerase sigma factor [Pedobacter sp.]|nr:MAG: sigma-70 family RNA polymerase sigma factor [Pedobacter sp.]